MTEKTKARQILVEASAASPAGTLQDLIEDRELYRETNIVVEQGEYDIEIKSSTGTSGTIPAATVTTAGSMSKDDKTKLVSLPEGSALSLELDGKVDKEVGMSLVADAEILKLSQLRDDATISSDLLGKVDKENGKGLIEPAPIDGKQYAQKDGSWAEVISSGGGGASALADLTDVSLGALADGEVLSWDETAGEWINKVSQGGAAALSDLTDVDFGTPTDGQVLTYDAATQKSKFADQAGGGGDVEEAPLDGRSYARKDAGWTEALAISYPPGEGQILKSNLYGDLTGSDIFTGLNQKDPNYSNNEFYVYRYIVKNSVAAGFPFEGASGLFMAGTEGLDPHRTHQVFFTTSGIFVRNADGPANSAGITWGSWIKYIEDAPNDGKAYVRKNGNWVDITTI